MVIQNDFWKDKRVFVTGHNGFKGSWLTLTLASLNANVLGYSLFPHKNSTLISKNLNIKNYNSVVGDICDSKHLTNSMVEFDPHIIIHMAAQPIVRRSYDAPAVTVSTNVMGTVNVLEAARMCNSTRAILNITTDKVYSNLGTNHAYSEQDVLGGKDLYSASKSCSELVTEAYFYSFFEARDISLATARAGNIVGGGDWSIDRIVPDIIRAVNSGELLDIRNPSSTRPWQHVLDAVLGYLQFCQFIYLKKHSSVIKLNFGPSTKSTKSVSEIVAEFKKFFDIKENMAENYNNNKKEEKYLTLNSEKAFSLLGWEPQLKFEDAVEKTAIWYRRYLKGEDPIEITLDQIKSYFMMKV